MNYILFDDETRLSLLPFTFTRTAGDIRIGILTIQEKWERYLGQGVSYFTEEYLNEKYTLAVVTNGFEEIQNKKLSSSKLTHYFKHIVTSQKAGCKKPSKEIFDYALRMNGAQCHQAIMIGDNLITDMGGARNSSIDSVFFNPDSLKHDSIVNYEINSLAELRQIL